MKNKADCVGVALQIVWEYEGWGDEHLDEMLNTYDRGKEPCEYEELQNLCYDAEDLKKAGKTYEESEAILTSGKTSAKKVERYSGISVQKLSVNPHFFDMDYKPTPQSATWDEIYHETVNIMLEKISDTEKKKRLLEALKTAKWTFEQYKSYGNKYYRYTAPKFSSDKLAKGKDWDPNPWAVCTKSVGREDKAKYERCVKHVKEGQ